MARLATYRRLMQVHPIYKPCDIKPWLHKNKRFSPRAVGVRKAFTTFFGARGEVKMATSLSQSAKPTVGRLIELLDEIKEL
ncbi:unnamed protein product, partial [Wuchereria bancrofti]